MCFLRDAIFCCPRCNVENFYDIAYVKEGKVRIKGQSAYSADDFEKTVPLVKPAVLQSWAHALDDQFIRAGSRVGCKVTLRGERMYEFYDRLVNITLARIRDFRGISPNSFDGRGNFALGMKEQLTFPEIDYDKIDKVRGMDIIICTTAPTDEEARALLKAMGMPFQEK